MSLVEKSQENDQKEPKILHQEDDETNDSDAEDKNMRTKDLLNTSQGDERTINPLLKEDFSQFKEDETSDFSISSSKETKTGPEDRPFSKRENKPSSSTLCLLKEDFSQFKEDETSNFSIGSSKDKNTKTALEDRPSSQTENKPAISTLDLLKEDFSQFKEDVSSVFSISSSKDKETKTGAEDCPSSQTENKPASITFILFKEDLSHFREDLTSVFSISSSKDKETKTGAEDRPLSLTENRPAISTLALFKEDLNQFKEDVTSIFGVTLSNNKNTKTALEDRPSLQTENKPAISTLGLLKEDFSLFKEDVSSLFSISSSKDKETKTINRLNILKEDLNNFKDDLSNVFKIGLSKERDTAKEDSSNTFKIKVLQAERTDEPFGSLFRRDQKTSRKAEHSQEVKKTFSEMREPQMDDGFRGNLSETVDAEKVNNNMKDWINEPVCVEKTESQSEERIPPSQADEQRCGSEEGSDDSSAVSAEDQRIKEEEEEEEEKPLETLLWEPLSSGISLFTLRDPNKDDTRDQPGDEWSVKNFACYLTFDPNTANSELRLTDCNREAARVWSDHQPSDHPDRFRRCPQVLCREGLLDSAYWEVVWSGGADVGVTYNSIFRDGDTASCLLGHNERSWSLECSEGSYTPCHNTKRFRSSAPRPFSRRVGIYLDWSAGSLSFYCVSQDTMVHLHTFTSTFTEPLYPAFWVWAYDGSVSLCHVALE